MAKIKNASDRFYEFVSDDIALEAMAEQDGPRNGSGRIIDWGNKAFRAAVAETALRIASFYGDDCLKKAFDAAQLDPDDPESWATLLRIFALAHFGPTRKRGGTRVWDSQRWSQLLADFAAVKSSHPKKKDGPVCELILENYPDQYPDLDWQTLRRNLQPARKAKTNEYLQLLSEQFEKSIEETASRHGPKMSRTEVKKKAIQMAIEKIAIEWKRPSANNSNLVDQLSD